MRALHIETLETVRHDCFTAIKRVGEESGLLRRATNKYHNYFVISGHIQGRFSFCHQQSAYTLFNRTRACLFCSGIIWSLTHVVVFIRCLGSLARYMSVSCRICSELEGNGTTMGWLFPIL